MAFRGWRAEALEFYDGLEADNSKTYWTAHKATYDNEVYTPMVALLTELEPEFGAGKIFRPYRDLRFSADKSPYKTAIGATLEEGGYIQLSANGLAVGSGMYEMAADQLERYRAAVAADGAGGDLEKLIDALSRKGIEITGHDRLKAAPRGYPQDHPRIELLRNKGLIAWREWPPAAWLGTPAAKRRIVDFFRAAGPLNQWLESNVGPTTAPQRSR
jgi:uncharacterized protein (TIGR02453 family)